MGGVSALLAAVMLIAGSVGFLAQAPGLGLRNWLVVLFQINSGLGRLPADAFSLLNPVDLVVLTAVGVAYLGLWPGPARPHQVWMVIAVAMPFAGILVLVLTGEWGRSGVMGAGIIVAVLMAVDRVWVLAGIGLAANGVLLVADFATGEAARPFVAALAAAGYLLLIAWFILVGAMLLRRVR